MGWRRVRRATAPPSIGTEHRGGSRPGRAGRRTAPEPCGHDHHLTRAGFLQSGARSAEAGRALATATRLACSKPAGSLCWLHERRRQALRRVRPGDLLVHRDHPDQVKHRLSHHEAGRGRRAGIPGSGSHPPSPGEIRPEALDCSHTDRHRPGAGAETAARPRSRGRSTSAWRTVHRHRGSGAAWRHGFQRGRHRWL